MSNRFSTVIFASAFIALITLSCFPVIFDWSNRIHPWIFHLPFSMFWQLCIITGMCLLLAVWCIADSISGDLDMDIDHVHKEHHRDL